MTSQTEAEVDAKQKASEELRENEFLLGTLKSQRAETRRKISELKEREGFIKETIRALEKRNQVLREAN